MTSSSNRTLGVRDEVPVEGFAKLSSLEAACRTAGRAMRGRDVLFGCGRSDRRRRAVQCGSRRAASRHLSRERRPSWCETIAATAFTGRTSSVTRQGPGSANAFPTNPRNSSRSRSPRASLRHRREARRRTGPANGVRRGAGAGTACPRLRHQHRGSLQGAVAQIG